MIFVRSMLTRYMVCLAAGLLAGCADEDPTIRGLKHQDPTGKVTAVVSAAAASDLQYALADVIRAFEKVYPDIHVEVTYGSSGNFYAQLLNRAPFDIFFSADVQYTRQLVEQCLAAKESEFHYGVGQIVVWVPKESNIDVVDLGIRSLLEPSVRKIAIANPRHAPYGRAAEDAMKNLGVYDQVMARFVLGDNVAQAAQFIESGSADIGIIALSLAMAPALRDKGKYWKIPSDAYPRIEQGGVLLNSASDYPSAELFRSFVIGVHGRKILQQYGFVLPEE